MYNILVYICYCVTYINKESSFNVCELGRNCMQLGLRKMVLLQVSLIEMEWGMLSSGSDNESGR